MTGYAKRLDDTLVLAALDCHRTSPLRNDGIRPVDDNIQKIGPQMLAISYFLVLFLYTSCIPVDSHSNRLCHTLVT